MKLKYERPVVKNIHFTMPGKYGMKTINKPITHIDAIPIERLIKEYGSPLFVISEQTIRSTFEEAKRAFTTRYPKVQFAWSYKTNYLNAVCNLFHQMGSWAEVVSGFEYEKAIGNGVDGKNIIFNGPYKSKAELEMVISKGSYIHIDNFDELYTIIEIAETHPQRPKLAIRVNMDTGIFPQWDRFGFNFENGEAMEALNRIMLNKKLDLVGLHCHIGTYVNSVAPYQVATTKLAALAVKLWNKYNHRINYIDLGGGFASKNSLKGAYLPGTDTCPSFDQYADAITSALINSEINSDYLPTLILESGRALIDDAGFLLGTVLANKRLADGQRATIIDIGVNILFTAFWYEHNITPAKEFSNYLETTTIYGPLCMNIDIIRQNLEFPSLHKGDQVVISRVGAYNMTQWLQFITYRPSVVMIDTSGKVHVIREKENIQSIAGKENLPEHLKYKSI